MNKLLQTVSSTPLYEEALNYEKMALASSNLKTRYDYFNRAKSIRKIAKEIEKWETPTRGF